MTALLRRLIDIKPEEVRAALWSCAYFFFILGAYFILRPIRDQAGAAGGIRNLPWLFTGTMIAMLLVNPAFAALVARLPRMLVEDDLAIPMDRLRQQAQRAREEMDRDRAGLVHAHHDEVRLFSRGQGPHPVLQP